MPRSPERPCRDPRCRHVEASHWESPYEASGGCDGGGDKECLCVGYVRPRRRRGR